MEKLKNMTRISAENVDLFCKDYLCEGFRESAFTERKIALDKLDLSNFKQTDKENCFISGKPCSWFFLIIEYDLKKTHKSIYPVTSSHIYRLVKIDDLYGRFELVNVTTNGFCIDENGGIKF